MGESKKIMRERIAKLPLAAIAILMHYIKY
jgi:hypothetical protein